MASEELNDTLLHAVPDGWAKQSYPKWWDFKGNTYKETCEMFVRMEIAKIIYEGGTPSKTTIRVYSNRASNCRK